jgi:hypothetical protein
VVWLAVVLCVLAAVNTALLKKEADVNTTDLSTGL